VTAASRAGRHPGSVPRPLTPAEIDGLLAAVVPVHLATVDAAGYPHVTPLWFEWDGEAFWMTSLPGKGHVARLRANCAASVCLDVEVAERDDGERPNQQIRAIGTAGLFDDVNGARTRSITYRYLAGASRDRVAERRSAVARVAIRLEPQTWIAVASV
jgi:hypothetical protein